MIWLFVLLVWGFVLRGIAFATFAQAFVSLGVRFCTWRGRVRVITRPNSNEAYLVRYALLGWLPGDGPRPWALRWLPNIYLHNIRLPDADPAVHNHPWPWAVSLILQGGYEEERPGSYMKPNNVFWLKPGQFNTLKKPRDFHRISDVYEYRFSSGETMRGEGCWTLFATSPRHAGWGFQVPGAGFVPHQIRNALSPIFTPRELETQRIGLAQVAALRALNARERSDADERRIIPT